MSAGRGVRAERGGRGAERGADFWSRRRAAVAAEEAHETREARPPEPEAEALDALPDEEALAALGLPDPDTLGPGDDFAAFMGRAVPATLRRRALRRLWTSNPTLANLDALVDYGQDFGDAATSAGRVATAYEVGRGIARRFERLVDAAADDTPGDGDGPSDGALSADAGARPEASALEPRADGAKPSMAAGDDAVSPTATGARADPDPSGGPELADEAIPDRPPAPGGTARATDTTPSRAAIAPRRMRFAFAEGSA